LTNAAIDPAPRRSGPAWSLSLRSQAEAIAACGFFTAGLLDGTQAHVVPVIEHASRRIRILGVTLHPTQSRTARQARNLLMDLGEQAHRVKFMIRGRGSNVTAASGTVLADAGIRTVLCNVRTPRMNAIAERWTGGCRRELLDRTLVWNQAHLRRILRAYEIHHNQHRPHRSLGAAAPLKPLPEPVDLERYRVRRRTHTGCLINEYRLVALRGQGFRHAHVITGVQVAHRGDHCQRDGVFVERAAGGGSADRPAAPRAGVPGDRGSALGRASGEQLRDLIGQAGLERLVRVGPPCSVAFAAPQPGVLVRHALLLG